MGCLMEIISTGIPDFKIIETSPYKDSRGIFARFFCREELKDLLHGKEIEQVNYSLTTTRGAIRGMHFQHPPAAETKMVRCLRGEVFDVIVDLRKDSKTFLKWHGEILSAAKMKMIYIPEGFAHGFQTLEDNCELLYLHTSPYSEGYEGGLHYLDPKINIEWPLEVTELSGRDRNLPFLTSDFSGIDL